MQKDKQDKLMTEIKRMVKSVTSLKKRLLKEAKEAKAQYDKDPSDIDSKDRFIRIAEEAFYLTLYMESADQVASQNLSMQMKYGTLPEDMREDVEAYLSKEASDFASEDDIFDEISSSLPVKDKDKNSLN